MERFYESRHLERLIAVETVSHMDSTSFLPVPARLRACRDIIDKDTVHRVHVAGAGNMWHDTYPTAGRTLDFTSKGYADVEQVTRGPRFVQSWKAGVFMNLWNDFVCWGSER